MKGCPGSLGSREPSPGQRLCQSGHWFGLVWYKLAMTNNGREESESKMGEWVKEKVKVKGDWKGKWWRKAALTPQPTCNRIWHIFCLEKHSKTLIQNTAMDNPCCANNKQPTHWRWVRNPMRWKGARTRVSMVRSNSDLTSVDWYFLTDWKYERNYVLRDDEWACKSRQIVRGLPKNHHLHLDMTQSLTHLYSKMLLLQVLAASPSAPTTDKQERNMPRPWQNFLSSYLKTSQKCFLFNHILKRI